MSALAPYLEAYATHPKPQPWLRAMKDAALQRAETRGFPAARDEAWKYTSLATLEKRGFRPASSGAKLGAAAFEKLRIEGLDCPCAVFVNGRYDVALSRLPKGVRVVPSREADESLRALIASPGAWQDDTFLNLNTALFQEALVIEFEGEQQAPLEVLHVSLPEMDSASYHLRCVMKLAPHARALLIERYVGIDGARHFTNAALQVRLEAGAQLTHVRSQEESPQGFHIGRVLVHQAADSRYISHNLQTGSAWSRLDLAVELAAGGAEAELDGLYAVTGRQHIDNHTRVDHLAPHTASRELYRGILDGHGRAVFNGKVVVAKHAVKTDAAQANHNLLLSRGAEIDTKPELEIYADDVKCSHGATIGRLDDQQLFYLRSRGIDAEAARALLIGAFAGRLTALLPLPALAAHARRRLGGAIREINLLEQP
jgi:Fe-S cluster assembly protein SufD